jgi:hypothetical protein
MSVYLCLSVPPAVSANLKRLKLGMEALNPKSEVEFVCGANRVLTSGFMPPSWILAYYNEMYL